MTRIFFATDIHGSDICWKKFLNAGKFYNAAVLVLGGDMTGKALVPIVQLPNGTWQATLLQQAFILKTEDEVRDMERRVGSRGYYPFRITPVQLAEFEADPVKVDQFFHQQMLRGVAAWMALADERLAGSGRQCFVCPGNDDAFEVDEVVRRAKHVTLAELLLTKLQIVQLNAKDLRDLCALLYDHALGDHDTETINLPRLTQLCVEDWGLWKTVTLSLKKVQDFCDAYDLVPEFKATMVQRVDSLRLALDAAPKSFKWKLRARVGEKLQWYELPEEVRRG